jgi:hypothetical protein
MNWKVFPSIKGSFDKNFKLNELFAFFVDVMNPTGEGVVPIDDVVNEDVL